MKHGCVRCSNLIGVNETDVVRKAKTLIEGGEFTLTRGKAEQMLVTRAGIEGTCDTSACADITSNSTS